MIEIREPCEASWDAMSGDDRVRFCAHCQKHVHNLSAMPRDEAERLVCESAGSLCVRFERSRAGGVVTLDYQQAQPRGPRWPLWTMAGLGAALVAAVLNLFYREATRGPSVVMGEMCPIPAAPTTGPTTAPATAPADIAADGSAAADAPAAVEAPRAE